MFTQTSQNGLRLKFVDFGFAREIKHAKDAKDDIKSLGKVFNNIIDFISFSTLSLEIGIKKIVNQMTNGSYSDILARDRIIYPMDYVYRWICGTTVSLLEL
jgi:hypothetical protein